MRLTALLALASLALIPLPAQAQPASRAQEVADRAQGLPQAVRKTKLDKLASSAFVFFRGTAFLSWRDTLQDSRVQRFGGAPGTRVWVTGDLHPENYGTFGLPGDDVTYGLNDFDEALVADYQVDLWRMAAGIELAGRELHVGRKKRGQAIERFARGYLEALGECAGPGNRRELDPRLPARALRSSLEDFRESVEDEASRKDMLKAWCRTKNGQRTFDLRLDDLEPVSAAEAYRVLQGFLGYVARATAPTPGFYRVKSLARRVAAGTGSLGSQRYYLLVEGPSGSQNDDLILDLKAQPRPAGWRHTDLQTRAGFALRFPSRGARVAFAERALLGPQRADPHLGWLRVGSSSYSVRQRSPFKGSFRLKKSHLRSAAEQWGLLLGYAHARADEDADPTLVPHSLEDEVLSRTRYRKAGFARLLVEVARESADRTEADRRALRALLP
jgi:uncharacterized protein (DUF2252 family)